MPTVAVTGSSGYIGRRLLELLDGRRDVQRVIAIDLRDPGHGARNVEFYRMDVRSQGLADVLAGADVLVHLAFVLAPQRDETEMYDVNVDGTRNVLAAAAEAGVRRIVCLSSAMAYGAHPDNDFPLVEGSPVRPVREYGYSAHKAEVEGMLDGLRTAHPETSVVSLRPCMVMGPNVSGVVASLVEAPFLAAVEGYAPPMQFVHEDDVARAIVHAIDSKLEGAYNVCPDGWLSQDTIAEILAKRRVVLDHDAAWARADRLWRLGLSVAPPSYLPFIMYPWVMSNEKLRSAGFTFEHTNEDALRDAARAHRGIVSLGRVRFRPRTLAAVAGAALVAGSVLRYQARRRLSV